MKTHFYNILVPKFLRNFDDYLLRNFPVVWRTKAIFVLFYGLVGAVLLFTSGFFYPVDAQHLTVAPVEPIEMGYENYHLYCAGFVSMSIFYWSYWQYQLGFPFTKLKDTLLTLLIYTACFWFLFGIVTPAFRIGTIYKTAYHWINNEELERFENSGIYPYGFVLLEEDEDKDFTKEILKDTFLQRRELIFKSIYAVEDSLLSYRYQNETKFWINWYDRHPSLNKTKLEYYVSNLSDLSVLSDLSYLSYRSNRPIRLDVLDRLYQSYMSNRSNLLDLSNLSSYNTYKNKIIQDFDIGTNPYKFLNTQDSTPLYFHKKNKDTFTVYRPTLPYSIENAVRSVKHARQFWQEKIYSRHWSFVFSYVLLISLLLYFVPMLSLRKTILLIAIYIVVLMNLLYDYYDMHFLTLPILSITWITISMLKKKNIKGTDLAINSLFVGLLFVMTFAFLVFFHKKTNAIPHNASFYGIQVLGVIGALLTTYVRTLPKQ